MPTAELLDLDVDYVETINFDTAEAEASVVDRQEPDSCDVILPSVRSVRSHESADDAQGEQRSTTGISQAAEVKVTPLVRLRDRKTPYRRYQVLQQWEGVVCEMAGDGFVAEIADLTNRANPNEIVELELSELSADDRAVVGIGSVFYWIIGYETRTGGNIIRTSEIRVKRLPDWSESKLESVRARGRARWEKFKDAGNRPAAD